MAQQKPLSILQLSSTPYDESQLIVCSEFVPNRFRKDFCAFCHRKSSRHGICLKDDDVVESNDIVESKGSVVVVAPPAEHLAIQVHHENNEEWEVHHTDVEGVLTPYYYHKTTGETTWDNPNEATTTTTTLHKEEEEAERAEDIEDESPSCGALCPKCGEIAKPPTKRVVSLGSWNDELLCSSKECRFVFCGWCGVGVKEVLRNGNHVHESDCPKYAPYVDPTSEPNFDEM
eukprot:PhF_6_TR10202/c0_g1_i2/m.15818